MNEIIKSSSPDNLISQAIDKDLSIEKLERLFQLKKDWDDQEAKKAFFKSLAKFQNECPNILKANIANIATHSGSNYSYKYATLSNITKTIQKTLSENGLSYRWEQQENGKICITCIITHQNGHNEKTTISSKIDSSGRKNDVQALASIITYLRRYTLTCALGISTAETDTDAVTISTNIEYIDQKQLHKLRDMLIDTESSEEKFCTYLRISDLEYLPKIQFNKALSALEKKHGGSV